MTINTTLILLAFYASNPSVYPVQTMDLVNQYRQKNNIPILRTDNRLRSFCQDRLQTLERTNALSHNGWNRNFNSQNTSYKVFGENLGSKYLRPREVVSAWQKSPNHNRNLLDRSYKVQFVCYSPKTQFVIQLLAG